MSDEKPLHVRVAEALGMQEVKRGGLPGLPSVIFLDTRTQYLEGDCPRFDTDWNATGWLIEKYRIRVGWSECPRHGCVPCWSARVGSIEQVAGGIEGIGATPLEAICEVLLALKEAGKLAA